MSLRKTLLILAAGLLAAGPTLAQPRPGARLAFPNEGRVNIFVVFVQFEDEPDGAGDFGSDPVTEWPHVRSLGPERRLPAWGEGDRLLAPPGTPPEAFDEGSLSAFYHLMSHGRFAVTGYVYPHVLHPAHPVDWYHPNRGAFQNGAVALAHELLTSGELQTYFAENPDGLDLGALDTFRNGTATFGADGAFDLIVFVHRDLVLPRLRLDRSARPINGSSITSFGADLALRAGDLIDYRADSTDAFASAPVTLGGLRVRDNLTSGSGVTIYALTRKQAVRGIAHEIGHRHFGFYPPCDNPLRAVADCLGLRTGASPTLSAGDRIKLGWAEVVPIDVPPLGRLDVTFPDALASGQVFRLRYGPEQCGDLIVEARFWNNFFDAPPNPDRPADPFFGNDDGDGADLFLPEEGLYLYKAPAPGDPTCGGSRSLLHDAQMFSSLENSGLGRRLQPFRDGPATDLRAFTVGGTYRTAFGPGDVYARHAHPRFFFHPNLALDERLSLTNIARLDGAFAAEVWTDFLAGPPEAQRPTLSAYPNPFARSTVLRYEIAEAGPARLDIFDLTGRLVARLAEGPHQPGLHEIRLQMPEGLPSGRYFARLDVGGRLRTVPLFLVRTP